MKSPLRILHLEDDQSLADYVKEALRREGFAVDTARSAKEGIQLADENLATRPFRFLAPANFSRLQSLRSKYDPTGLLVCATVLATGKAARFVIVSEPTKPL